MLGVEPNPQSYCLAFRSDSQALPTKTNTKVLEIEIKSYSIKTLIIKRFYIHLQID